MLCILFMYLFHRERERERERTRIHAPNCPYPTYMKGKVTQLRGEIENSTIIFGDLNILLSLMNRMTR